MAFTTATDHTTFLAALWNSFAAYSNGSASAGSNPVQWITLNDAANPVLLLKQNDTTTGRVLELLKADGTMLLKISKDGVTFSPDGISAGLTPASLSGIETFTGAKTFSAAILALSTLGVTGLTTLTGGVALGSRRLDHRGSTTASAGSITLPTDGNVIPISGTSTITAITAVTGMAVTLEFNSANCKVAKGSTLRLDGDFMSAAAGATLSLECDGTNWNEVGRAGSYAQACEIPASGQTLTDNAADTIMTLGTATYDPFSMKSGNTIVLPIAGLWELYGNTRIAATGAGPGNRTVTVYKGGSAHEVLGVVQTSSAKDFGIAWSIKHRYSAADTFDVRAAVAGAGGNPALQTTSYFGARFLANN